jgi:hypothetical protein
MNTRRNQSFSQRVKIIDFEGGMGLFGRAEIGFDSNVQLVIPELEPHPASSSEVRRLGNLSHAHHYAKEPAGRVFGIGRCRNLNVMEANDARRHDE